MDGKSYEEGLGWSSEGWTLDKARNTLAELRAARKTGTGPVTLKEKRAKAKAAKEAEVRAKALEDKLNVTLSDYWEGSYREFSKSTKKPASYAPEERHMRLYILPLLGDRPLVQLGFAEWDSLVCHMGTLNLSQRTKEYAAGTLRRLMRHAQTRGLPVQIPTSKQVGAQGPKDNRRLRVLTQEEAAAILDTLAELDPNTERLTRFCMLTGCRLSEAVKLTWADVDLSGQSVRFSDTKNKSSRTVYLSPELLQMLSLLPNTGAGELVLSRRDGKSFFTHADRSDTPHYFTEAVKALGLNKDRAPSDRVTFHTIRHTAATRLAKVLDVRSLMDVMGWKVVAMAARYIHTHEETKRQAVNTLAGAWKKPEQGKVLPFKYVVNYQDDH